jgi:phosphate starvation-inducible protein PhoH
LLFGSKNKLKVDLSELHGETENLSSYLSSNLKVEVTGNGKELQVSSENLSTPELKRTVRKFVYHRKLNNLYWVAVESGVVKVHKFKTNKKPKKHKRGESPAMFPHGF